MIYLPDNNLTGTIPPDISSLDQLESDYINVILPNNALSGTLPAELASLTKLRGLNVAYNQLSGTIPNTFGALPPYGYDTLICVLDGSQACSKDHENLDHYACREDLTDGNHFECSDVFNTGSACFSYESSSTTNLECNVSIR